MRAAGRRGCGTMLTASRGRWCLHSSFLCCVSITLSTWYLSRLRKKDRKLVMKQAALYSAQGSFFRDT